MQRVPSTQSLRALESFSRHGAVWKAAEELNLTRSAVSHQLRLLERDLDFALFSRVGTGIELTSRGKAFAKDVKDALSAISRSASRNAGNSLTGQLTISCTPGFAANWLSTKISEFRTMCPEVSLSVILPQSLDDVSNPEADVFVAFGDPVQCDLDCEVLRVVEFTPLVSPVLLNRLGGLQKPEDVLRGDLLHLAEREDWNAWLRLAGLSGRADNTGIVCADINMVYIAAINAQGIALGDEFICHNAMSSGQLIRPFNLATQPSKSYYLAVPPSKRDAASVIAFRNWILGELPRPETVGAS